MILNVCSLYKTWKMLKRKLSKKIKNIQTSRVSRDNIIINIFIDFHLFLLSTHAFSPLIGYILNIYNFGGLTYLKFYVNI